jgi:hypothetical protein
LELESEFIQLRGRNAAGSHPEWLSRLDIVEDSDGFPTMPFWSHFGPESARAFQESVDIAL